ncbi:MAG: hypothetical protein CMA72_06045 [Euryarchaeota archaeon]|nr:hypothetical protein [Euryarchaeota archaeon]|tara:strand:+ start:7341 stop:7751 length:411 start_codon:yes stop_codon:yes gene_type:complete
MSFASVRQVIETKIAAAYDPVPIVWDNVQETPPAETHVVCLISYESTNEPVICPGGGAVERLLGNLQLSVVAPRGKGMKAAEELAAQGMVAMNTMYDQNATTKVKCGRINGPRSVGAGPEPYLVTTLSCSFDAYVG